MREPIDKKVRKVDVELYLEIQKGTPDLRKSESFRYTKFRINDFLRETYFDSYSNKKENPRDEYTNYVYKLIETLTKKHFYKSDKFEIVLGNYQERQGSFLGFFTLFVVGTINNYSLFSENLERFIRDLQSVFHDEFYTQVEYHEQYEDVSSNIGQTKGSRPLTTTLRKSIFTKSAVIVASLLIAIAGVFDDQLFSDKYLPQPIQNQSFSYIDENDIEELILEEKEKALYHVYDEVIKEELRKAIVDQDTLRIEFLRSLQAEMNLEKAKIGIVEYISLPK